MFTVHLHSSLTNCCRGLYWRAHIHVLAELSFFLSLQLWRIQKYWGGGCNIQCIGPSVPSSFIANADSELDVLCVCYLPWCTVVLAETWIVGTNKLNLESFCMEKVTCWKFGKANRGRGQPLPAPHESTTALYSMWYCMHIFTYAILLYELSANYILWWRVDGIVFYFYYCSIVVFIHCKCSEVEYLYAISVAVPTTFS